MIKNKKMTGMLKAHKFLEGQPEGNYYDKYGSKNPIVKKLMAGFFKSLDKMLDNVKLASGGILEAGCGEGNVTNYMYEKFSGFGVFMEAFDISERVIEEAKKTNKKIRFFTRNIYNPFDNEKYDLIVCCEVLEHLDDPEDAVRNLTKLGGAVYIQCSP